MASYLFVDVHTLLARLRQRGISLDFYELAGRLRSGAALAAGLTSVEALIAIAVDNWDEGYEDNGLVNVRRVLEVSGFQFCNVTNRQDIGRVLRKTYLEPDLAINELILATNDMGLLSILDGVRLPPKARVRVWGEASAFPEIPAHVILQPLETILGLQRLPVALYIDFENIAISLDKQGYIVNLDHLIARFIRQARAHGQVIRMAAYAPWGQRGSLPALVDDMGRDITPEAPSRLAMANIDPVFTLPGKNSADMRIAKDVMADLIYPEGSADVFILASGDRDFNDVINSLHAQNKQAIVWGVRGSVSRQVEGNPGVVVEYIEDFTSLQPHKTLGDSYTATAVQPEAAPVEVWPSQWVSAILQYDRLFQNGQGVTRQQLEAQLVSTSAAISRERAAALLNQATEMGLFARSGDDQILRLNSSHPLVERTRLVRDRIVMRVANTLSVRGWEYVNYGFLIKGIAMDRELEQPGLNLSDEWRSEWIDCLVREDILQRELVPHRHNPDDLVPVIRLSDSTRREWEDTEDEPSGPDDATLEQGTETEIQAMQRRIIVSVEQFTSFRGFLWCPLGKLHRRLRPHDPGMVFQRAVEDLLEQGAGIIDEYDNPQSEFKTKGISLEYSAPLVNQVLDERDAFVRALLALYERHEVISPATLRAEIDLDDETLGLWLSIMEDEHVLNPLPGHKDQYSLFRTHHTVMSVAGTPG